MHPRITCILELFNVIFHHDKVPFKLRYCSIFKVLCRSPSRDSLFIISHQVLVVKHFFEIFLLAFQRLAVSRDSLIIIPHRRPHVNTFFNFLSVFSYRLISSAYNCIIIYSAFFDLLYDSPFISYRKVFHLFWQKAFSKL